MRTAVLAVAFLGLAAAPSRAAVSHQHVIVRGEYVPSGTVSKQHTGRPVGLANLGRGFVVVRGDSITFTNLDDQLHTVTACDPCDPFAIASGAFGSSILGPRRSWTLRTANLEPGTYGYFCLHHSAVMRGSVQVIEATTP